jgi:hypothetical protein
MLIISGRTTLQERPEDADDDDILILYDEDLVKEIDNLLSDLML